MKKTVLTAIWRRSGFSVVMIGMVLAGMQTGFAQTTYHIGGGSNNFATLEELRNAGALADGDTIILYQNDNSLTDRLVVTSSASYTLTIESNDPAVQRVIRPADGAAVKDAGGFFYSSVTGALDTLTLAGVRFEQFGITGNGGGEFDSSGNLTLTATAGTNTFSGNNAVVNGTLIGGWGGVIRANSLTLSNGTWQFINNLADGKNRGGSGQGGAILASSLTITGAKTVFTGNSAKGGIGISGQGGAIYSNIDLTITGGSHLFSGNSAVGGSGNYSGLGGAIYSMGTGDMTLSGNFKFLNNRAETTDPSNPTGGLGGAIYMDAWKNNRTFNLTTSAGETIRFQGNNQQNGPNSIYFGNTESASGTINAVFDTAAGSSILMYDPMESQTDSLGGAGNLTLNLEKTGDGLWLLGGTSNLNSATNVAVNGGTFRLDRNAQLNLNHAATANFSIASGAVFTPTIEGKNSISTITTNNFTADPGAQLKAAGISSLAAGNTTFQNAIVANTSNIDSGFVGTPTSGVMYADASYVANGTNDNQNLVVSGVKNMMDVFGTDPFLDAYRQTRTPGGIRNIFDDIYDTGVYNGRFDHPVFAKYFEDLKGNTVLNATGAHLISTRIFHHIMLDRMNPNTPRSSCAVLADHGVVYRGHSIHRKDTLWGEFTQNWTTQADVGMRSSYEYRPFAFTFGKERRIGRFVAGLAGEYTHGHVKGGDMVWTDSRLDTAALGLYTGYFGPRDYIKGNMQIGAGWNKENSRDYVNGTQTYGSFHSAALGAGLEFGRTFNMMCAVNPLTITPHAGTDYWFLNREAFDETGVNARSFGSANYNVVEIPFGLRIARTIPRTGGKADWIMPSVDLVYARSVGDGAPMSRASFIGIPVTWNAHGTEPGRDVFRTNTTVTARFNNRIDMGLGFDFEVRNHYSSEQLNFTVAMKR